MRFSINLNDLDQETLSVISHTAEKLGVSGTEALDIIVFNYECSEDGTLSLDELERKVEYTHELIDKVICKLKSEFLNFLSSP